MTPILFIASLGMKRLRFHWWRKFDYICVLLFVLQGWMNQCLSFFEWVLQQSDNEAWSMVCVNYMTIVSNNCRLFHPFDKQDGWRLESQFTIFFVLFYWFLYPCFRFNCLMVRHMCNVKPFFSVFLNLFLIGDHVPYKTWECEWERRVR